jgi:transposase-like protein
MNTKKTAPKTLLEAVLHFADLDTCHAHLANIKWTDGKVTCPACAGQEIGNIASRRMYQCKAKGCRKQFSVKVDTIFEDSPLPLNKWFVAVWSITNAKNGISSCELARALGVTQKSAWHMLHRVRHAMQAGTFQKFAGEVESDETYVGGLAKNMHASRRKQAIHGTGGVGKAIVHGLLERHTPKSKSGKKVSQVKAAVIPDVTGRTLYPILHDSIESGSHLYTDTLTAYRRMKSKAFIHERIDHAEAYVNGNCHTNSMENFWSLFKRAVKGTYVSVDAPHLNRYVGEQVFRFNERDGTDADRFAAIMPGVVGKRLTYDALIGKGGNSNE